jgi:hypothetical protein
MNKKLVGIAVAFISFIGGAKAQTVRLQVEGGLGLANIKIHGNITGNNYHVSSAINRAKPTFGLGVDLEMDRYNSLELSLMKVYGGGALFDRAGYSEYFHLNYWRVPLHYKFKKMMKNKREQVFLSFGPYIAFLTHGFATINGGPVNIYKGDYEILSGTDIGLGFTAGYVTRGGMIFRIGYASGIKDVWRPITDDRDKMYNYNNFAFTVGYQF